MVATDTIEGVINEALWFHYDIASDVLYLRKADCQGVATYADEQADGTMLLRRQDNDEVVGLTVVNWWQNYGNGQLPDSLRDIEHSIEPMVEKLAA